MFTQQIINFWQHKGNANWATSEERKQSTQNDDPDTTPCLTNLLPIYLCRFACSHSLPFSLCLVLLPLSLSTSAPCWASLKTLHNFLRHIIQIVCSLCSLNNSTLIFKLKSTPLGTKSTKFLWNNTKTEAKWKNKTNSNSSWQLKCLHFLPENRVVYVAYKPRQYPAKCYGYNCFPMLQHIC